MRSPKFLQADGGWNRVVWVPAEVKERVKDAIPEELFDKIATEKDVSSVEELKTFLKEKQHPVVERWVEEAVEVAEVAEASASKTTPAAPSQMQYTLPQPMQVPQMNVPITAAPGMGAIQLQGFISLPGLVPPGGGEDKITLVLKGVKIFAEKAYIKREKKG
jgi:acetyl-CoA decarbonylase/synthase complex subunit beta